jgi:hypothetical protein
MKTKLILSLVMALILTSSYVSLFAQNEHGQSSAQIGGGKVTIEYGRPALKGRDLNTWLPVGKLWRLGADIPTTLTSDVDLVLGDKTVPKGTYTLVAKHVEKGKWNLLVLSKGGAQNFDPSGVVAEVPLKVSEPKSPVELLTIDVSGKGKNGILTITWGTLKASTDLQAKKS